MATIFTKSEITEIASLIRSCAVWSEMVRNGIRKHSTFDLSTEEGKSALVENTEKVKDFMKWHDNDAKKLNEMLGEEAVTLYFS